MADTEEHYGATSRSWRRFGTLTGGATVEVDRGSSTGAVKHEAMEMKTTAYPDYYTRYREKHLKKARIGAERVSHRRDSSVKQR